jgi:MFS family permease
LLSRIPGPALVTGGAAVGAVGSALAALAPSAPLALVGIFGAGLGTSVCMPTLISMASAWAGPERRAGAVPTVVTIGYLGFLIGPALIGLVAGATTLPTALIGVACLAVLLATLAPLTARLPVHLPRSPLTAEGHRRR